jgi:hypothetical protein
LQVAQPVGIDEQPLPMRHAIDGHSDASMHDIGPLHVTSQAHEFPHFVRRLHEPAPVHATSHSPDEH